MPHDATQSATPRINRQWKYHSHTSLIILQVLRVYFGGTTLMVQSVYKMPPQTEVSTHILG